MSEGPVSQACKTNWELGLVCLVNGKYWAWYLDLTHSRQILEYLAIYSGLLPFFILSGHVGE